MRPYPHETLADFIGRTICQQKQYRRLQTEPAPDLCPFEPSYVVSGFIPAEARPEVPSIVRRWMDSYFARKT